MFTEGVQQTGRVASDVLFAHLGPTEKKQTRRQLARKIIRGIISLRLHLLYRQLRLHRS